MMNRSTSAVRSARAVAASPVMRKLEGRVSTIVIADANRLGDFVDENLAVSDLPGSGGCGEGPDHFLATVVGDHHLELHLGEQIDLVLLAAVNLFMSFLAAVAAHFRDRHTIDPDFLERILHFIDLERLND